MSDSPDRRLRRSEFMTNGIGPRKETSVFGRMMVTPIVQGGRDAGLQAAITPLLEAAEHAEIVSWIEFPASVLLFLLVRGIRNPGGVYVHRPKNLGPR